MKIEPENKLMTSLVCLVMATITIVTVFSWIAAGCGNTRATDELSEHFVARKIGRTFSWKAHTDLYLKDVDGVLTYLASVPEADWSAKFPWGFKGLESRYFAISGDGKSLVYAHNFGPPEKKIYGIYHRRYDGDERLVLKGYIGATNYGKSLPPEIVAIGIFGVTTDGELVELALWQGSSVHHSAFFGNVKRLDSLITSGSDIYSRNYWDYTPLELAIVRRHEEAAIRLIREGPEQEKWPALFLSLAAAYKLPRAVNALLENGADPNNVGVRGLTPLTAAIHLPSIGPYAEVAGEPDRRLYRDIMPLAVEILRALLAAGADPDDLSQKGVTPDEILFIENYYWWDRQDHPEFRDSLAAILAAARG